MDKILVLFWLVVLCPEPSQQMNDGNHVTIISEQSDIHCDNDSTCPTWFICAPEKNCQCGKRYNDAVLCNVKELISVVLDCNCVTYDEDNQSTYLGACFYNCGFYDHVYMKLPESPQRLVNNSVCTDFHRTGILCGDCEDGHSPLVFSYSLSCVKCPDGHKNWWRFILVAFVPLTFFYFFVVLFNINVTSSRLHGVVWFSQALSMPALVRLIMINLVRHGDQWLVTTAKVFLLFCSFWNLDLLRSIIPDICLSVTTLQALALEYLIALYPFALILVSYFTIKLYDRNFAPILIVWKPFRKIIMAFRKSWDVHTSVIDSFATFFLLSYNKILSVTADILVPTQIYELGSNSTKFGVYYSPTVKYLQGEHLPYAITALVILTSFVIIPTIILILYPFQFFQKLLSAIPINWHFLRAFIDSFQGCYKDGTEPGTSDCRWFSISVLLIRLLLFVVFGLSFSIMFFVYAPVILMIFLIVIINVQPFKKVATRYPSTDIVFLTLLSLFYIVLIGRDLAYTQAHYTKFTSVVTFSSAFVPIIYIWSLIMFWFIARMKWIRTPV